MNRKNFLSSLLGLGAGIQAVGACKTSSHAASPSVAHGNTSSARGNAFSASPTSSTPSPPPAQTGPSLIPPGLHIPLVTPAYLRPGDTIGITCPAGAITAKEIQPALLQLQNWGFKVKIGDTVGKKDFTFGGTDAERLADLQQMMDDPDLKAILCARGGYGAVHIIDRLDLTGIATHPKWIIGFSDITVILCHLHARLNMASIHSKMCNSFPDDWNKAEPVQIQSILSIQQALVGERIDYPIAPYAGNRIGTGTGQLVGGNLKTLETLSGTRSDIDTRGKILFVEDTGEYLYSIDRMFWNLERTGKLAGLSGLVVGGFKVKPDDPGEEFGKTVYDIVLDRVKYYNYPVCFDFPVGHQKSNFALKYGIPHTLMVQPDKISLVSADIPQLAAPDS